MTGEIVNLNRARKARAKDGAKARAAENRVRFGRPKAERERAAAGAAAQASLLDGLRREPPGE